jgi:hypothetical protein
LEHYFSIFSIYTCFGRVAVRAKCSAQADSHQDIPGSYGKNIQGTHPEGNCTACTKNNIQGTGYQDLQSSDGNRADGAENPL